MLLSLTNCLRYLLWGGIDIVYEGIVGGIFCSSFDKKSLVFIIYRVSLVLGLGSRMPFIKFLA